MSHTVSDIAIVPFAEEHLEGALALSRQVGWPHRPEDWALVLAVSQGVAALSAGRVVGTAFCTPFGAQLAAINMIIVEEGMRGSGLGRRLMNAVMAIGGDRTLRLVATEAGLPLYEKLGFVSAGEIVQHQGIATATDEAPPPADGVGAADAEAVAALDAAAFGAERRRLITRLVAEGTAAMLRRNGRVAAFALCRPFGKGRVVGPVVAATPEDARHLIAVHFSRHHGSFLRVDTASETGLGSWLAERGLSEVGGGTVMYRGAFPPVAPGAPITFALASQALG